MTYKQIEASREARLWIGQIIVPIIGFGAMIATNPEARQAVTDRVEKTKRSIEKRKFKVIKKEEES